MTESATCGRQSHANNRLAILALAVSIVSLAVAVRACQDARLNLAPVLAGQLTFNPSGAGFLLANTGGGTAFVEWATLTLDSTNISSWREFNEGLQLPSGVVDVEHLRTPRGAGVISRVFWAYPGDKSRDLMAAIETGEPLIQIAICYCSIHKEECWLSRWSNKPGDAGSFDESCPGRPEAAALFKNDLAPGTQEL